MWSTGEIQCQPCLSWKKLLISLWREAHGGTASVCIPHFAVHRLRPDISDFSALCDSRTLGTLPACLERSQCSALPLSWGPRREVRITTNSHRSQFKMLHRGELIAIDS